LNATPRKGVDETSSSLVETGVRTSEVQEEIRADIFRWLDDHLATGSSEFSHIELKNYTYRGERIPLKDGQKGIWNPQGFDATLSITTSFKDPYADELGDDLSLKYSYQSSQNGDNIKLRRAMELHSPLIYFKAIRSGTYVAYYPAYVIRADDLERKFSVALNESLRFFTDPTTLTFDQRRYAERTVRRRLHQPVFRAKIMRAYASTCAVCLLKHADLLDAAHIIGDSEVHGFASVANGIALCKLHHAAYDRNLMGITPDFEVRIDAQLLDEVDGPMLRHGLQDMHRRKIQLPNRRADYPSSDALATRFDQFAAQTKRRYEVY
jgi:putative restriction endonuclease